MPREVETLKRKLSFSYCLSTHPTPHLPEACTCKRHWWAMPASSQQARYSAAAAIQSKKTDWRRKSILSVPASQLAGNLCLWPSRKHLLTSHVTHTWVSNRTAVFWVPWAAKRKTSPDGQHTRCTDSRCTGRQTHVCALFINTQEHSRPLLPTLLCLPQTDAKMLPQGGKLTHCASHPFVRNFALIYWNTWVGEQGPLLPCLLLIPSVWLIGFLNSLL